MSTNYSHLLALEPPRVSAAGDFRWALGLLKPLQAVSYSSVSAVARRSRRLIGHEGCAHQDVRDEVTAAMAGRGAEGSQDAAASTDGSGSVAGSGLSSKASVRAAKIDDLKKRLRVSDSRNAEEVAKALDAVRGRRRAERRLEKLKVRLRQDGCLGNEERDDDDTDD